MNHLGAAKLPRVRASIRSSLYRSEEDRAERESARAERSSGSGTGALSPTNLPTPQVQLTTAPAKNSSLKRNEKRISMAAVGHTALGAMLRRGHVASLRQKTPRVHVHGSATLAALQRQQELVYEIPTILSQTQMVGEPDKSIPRIPVNIENPEDDLKSNVSQTENILDSEMVFINCSGFQYVTTEKTLARFPNSLLGNPNKREEFYSCKLQAYYFDRHRACFESILQFYQTGIECPPPYIDLHIYHEEKDFYGLKRSRDTVLEISESLLLAKMEEKNCLCCAQKRKFEIHRFLIGTPTTICASIYHVTDIIMIGLSTVLFLLESEPKLESHFDLKAAKSAGADDTAYWLFGLNALTILWFTIDIIVRMVTWPVFLSYWKDIMNILDVISVLPFYIELMQWNSDSNSADSTYQILRALRLIRVIRVFKFVRHSQSMMVILKAVVKARHELLVLFVCIFLFVITFGSIMFYLEGSVLPLDGSGPDTPFSSILLSCWWVLVSITTVGFGDMYPITVAGKFLGSVVLCLGIVCLALPMTIIVTKFSIEFDREKS